MHAERSTTGYLLWRVAIRWRAATDRAVAPLGLTHAQFSLLASLYGLSRSGAQPSQRELADFSGLDPIYVSKLARALEQAGLLARAGHPGDTRAVQLRLTARGTEVALRAISIVRDLHEELTAPIGGTQGQRNRELATTLQILLEPSTSRTTDQPTPDQPTTDQNGSDAMSPTTTPTLTGQDIGEAEGAARGLLDEVLAGSGVTSDGYIVLRVLTFRGPYESPAELHGFLAGQRQLRLDPPAVAALLAGLEDRGLIQGASPEAGGPAQLTDEGAALHARLAETVSRTTSRLYDGIEPDDLATAHRVLVGVIERADHLRGELAQARPDGVGPPAG